jgi:predicted negative regulator of RcsB-dependent stress response
LGEVQLAAGDKKGAMTNYKLALAKAPENQKKRIEGIIQKI